MIDSKPHLCEVCGARVAELRRGRCWGCYTRWAETRPVGLGAICSVCHERRRENLRLVELHGSWLPMCHNCAHKSRTLDPPAATLDGLRRRMTRERRANERRRSAFDTRPPAARSERRGLERREVGLVLDEDDLLLLVDDDMLIEIIDDDDLEPSDPADPASGEETRIVSIANCDGF